MTVEHRITVGLDDITAVIFTCNTKGCNSKWVLTPENTGTPPSRCPIGHAWEWDEPNERQTTASPFMFFLIGLNSLRNPLSKRAGFTVRLEFQEPVSG